VIQSPRIHHSLFIRNTLIFQTCTSILEHISSVHRSRASKSFTGSGKLGKKKNKAFNASSTPGIDFTLEDPAAAQFWLKNWPNDDFLVPWPIFQAALLTEFPNASIKTLSSLQYFLDFSQTMMVSKSRLNTFCKLSPSFEDLMAFPAVLMSKPWFAGYLSKSEATMLLNHEPPNTFLVRLHKNNRGALACSYTSNRGVQHHVIIREKSGYSMSHCAGTFATIDELIAHNSFLQHALAEPWMRSVHFLGEATKEDAEQILDGLHEGIYVLRLQSPTSTPPPSPFSPATSSSGTPTASSVTLRETPLCISATASAGTFRHANIPRDSQGNVVVNGTPYPDLQAYLDAHKSVFSMPFSPSLPRFRTHLDSKLSPSLNTHVPSNASRFSASLNMSNSSSLSLSSSVGIPRTLSNDSDFSPAISRDDLSLPSLAIGSSSTAIHPEHGDYLPIIDVQTLSLHPVPSSKRPWTPLTSSQINPLGITYKDMWAELLRYYHVPVPEAKIPPKTADR